MRLDLHSLLFGDILAVSRLDLALIWGGGAIALGALLWIWRPLLAATVNPDLAAVAGLRPERTRLVFGFLVAVVIAASIKVVGILLIVALLVIPARRPDASPSSPERMAVGASIVGVLSVGGGLLCFGGTGHAIRPSIVVAALALFVVTRIDGLWPGRRAD